MNLPPAQSGCWLNSGPCGHRTEVAISLLAVSQGVLSAVEGLSRVPYHLQASTQLWNPSRASTLRLPFCHQPEKTLCFERAHCDYVRFI